jgi:hypothetical protein
MTMAPAVRKFALTMHVASSVGWLGAVVGSLAAGIIGLISPDDLVVRAIYLTMEVTGWSVLVPFSLASLLTGFVLSLGTSWGFLRHYWVLMTLAINVVAIVVLLLYMQTLTYLAGIAAQTPAAGGGIAELRNPSPVAHAGAALLLLLVATALSVYKPRGMTRYGQRHQRALPQRARALSQP